MFSSPPVHHLLTSSNLILFFIVVILPNLDAREVSEGLNVGSDLKSQNSSKYNDWRRFNDIDLLKLEEQWMNDDVDEDDIPIDEDIYAESEQRREEAFLKMERLMSIGQDYDDGASGASNSNDELVKAAMEAGQAGKAPLIFVKLQPEFLDKIVKKRR